MLNAGGGGDTVAAIPLQVFGQLDSTREKGFYKPCAAWWRVFSEHLNGKETQLDCARSFYCGDAGGRLRGDLTNPWQAGTDMWDGGYWVCQPSPPQDQQRPHSTADLPAHGELISAPPNVDNCRLLRIVSLH